MSYWVAPSILFGGLVIAFSLGIPVVYALGGTAIILGFVLLGPSVFLLITPAIESSLTDFLLLSMPLFLFMGQAIQFSGFGERLFRALHVLAGPVRGGLAIGVILGCSILGAMVGIIGVGIMTAGSVALKPMLQRGYDRSLALGSIMAGGGLGILIPPSIPMIVFSAATNTSLGRLFVAGVVPAAILIVLFVAYIGARCWYRPEFGPALPPEERRGVKTKAVAVGDTFVAFGLVFAVLGTIVFGFATPTEAAAVGALAALGLAVVYRKFNLSLLAQASIETATMTATFMWILFAALVFSNLQLFLGVGEILREFTVVSGLPPIMVIILMQVCMILLGFIMDEFVIVVLCAPLFTPIAVGLGFEPIWFGILMILNMEIAIQTPPYGFALFYLKSVAPPDVTMGDIYKSIGPFLAIKLIVLVLVLAFPQLATWLPDLVFN